MKTKKCRKIIATTLAASSFAGSTPKQVSAFEWESEYTYIIIGGVVTLALFGWGLWEIRKAEQARQAEYQNRRRMASNIQDDQFRNVCLNLVEIIPVGDTGNEFYANLCTDKLNVYYGGSVENWTLQLASQVDLSSDKLSKIRLICNQYLPKYGPVDELIDQKADKEREEARKRLERQKMYEESYQREQDRQLQEKLLDKNTAIKKICKKINILMRIEHWTKNLMQRKACQEKRELIQI